MAVGDRWFDRERENRTEQTTWSVNRKIIDQNWFGRRCPPCWIVFRCVRPADDVAVYLDKRRRNSVTMCENVIDLLGSVSPIVERALVFRCW